MLEKYYDQIVDNQYSHLPSVEGFLPPNLSCAPKIEVSLYMLPYIGGTKIRKQSRYIPPVSKCSGNPDNEPNQTLKAHVTLFFFGDLKKSLQSAPKPWGWTGNRKHNYFFWPNIVFSPPISEGSLKDNSIFMDKVENQHSHLPSVESFLPPNLSCTPKIKVSLYMLLYKNKKTEQIYPQFQNAVGTLIMNQIRLWRHTSHFFFFSDLKKSLQSAPKPRGWTGNRKHNYFLGA